MADGGGVLRHVGGTQGVVWHWGLGVGDGIFEVNGAMAVYGPKGMVAATGPGVGPKHGTKQEQFHAYLPLPNLCLQSDGEIETFSKQWCKLHPVYIATGPNCQTYAEDLYTFLTGGNMPFSKTMEGQRENAPERHTDCVWLVAAKKPAS